ncbi:AraC family transcriptional regulator [Halodesulfovibrio aestuarii]|uniref:AraC family transcriptional regulator n=1 Tax=Halodesulfovibrio aestuarii TaxID=126333 RepID=UPI00039B4C4F
MFYSNRQLIDIALKAGYGSQEAFTRAFKRWCDYTPKYYRKWSPEHEFLSGETLMNAKHNLLEKCRYDAWSYRNLSELWMVLTNE